VPPISVEEEWVTT